MRPFDKQQASVSRAKTKLSLLAAVLSCFGAFAMATGAADMVFGPGVPTASGAVLGQAAGDLWLNSQLRFQGAIWFGWGVTLIWTCRDLNDRGQCLQLLAGTLMLGGVARLIAAMPYPPMAAVAGFLDRTGTGRAPIGPIRSPALREMSRHEQAIFAND